jgi:peptidoglycan-associated lipoprotein
MKRIAVLIVLALSLLATVNCRSRKPVKPPETVPTRTEPARPAETSERVTPPSEDFPAREIEEPEVLSSDIREANRMARERGWIRDAFFEFDASTLSEDAQQALQQSATWLRSHPEYDLLIAGHCDERGTEQYNLALGDRRAATAATYLATLGLDRSRIRTVSYGEERPFEEASDEAAWAQNRRAHLVLVGR